MPVWGWILVGAAGVVAALLVDAIATVYVRAARARWKFAAEGERLVALRARRRSADRYRAAA